MSLIRTHFVLALGLLLGASLLTFGAAKAANRGESLMQQVYDQSRIHKNQQAEAKLIIQDKSGRERTRYFRFLYKILPNRTKNLIKFYQPPSVKGTGLLSETEDSADETDQWIYLPALKSVKQLSSDDKNKSFMGSDFTNGDIAGRKVSQDRHKVKSENDQMAVVVSTPKKTSSPYSKIETHIIKQYKVPKEVVFYDRRGAKLKTLKSQVIENISGMYIVMEAVMINHRSGGQSQIIKSDFDVSRNINQNAVGFKGLQR